MTEYSPITHHTERLDPSWSVVELVEENYCNSKFSAISGPINDRATKSPADTANNMHRISVEKADDLH